jgi:hypothetical protein
VSRKGDEAFRGIDGEHGSWRGVSQNGFAQGTRSASGHLIYTVRISGTEIVAALFRRSRAGSLSLLDAQTEAAQFKADLPYDVKSWK